MPQTTLLTSDRIYVEFWAAKSDNQSRKIRFWFDSTHPSHIHTTLPSVAGSGLVKTVNGVYQTPASLLVNTDVAANAEIDQSKINGLTDVASKANSAFTTVQSNSANWSGFVTSNITGIGGATSLTNMMQITQAGYNAITPAVNTLYIIVG
jgi:transcriptional regulatory protein LevR